MAAKDWPCTAHPQPGRSGVSLSLREKQNFYHSLGQLLRSGVPFPRALETLGQTARGAQRRLLQQLKADVAAGKTIAEAVSAQRSAVSDMEAGVIAAVERTGRLEYGFAQLSNYFAALERARARVLEKSAYPLFVLHFGIFILSLDTLLTGAGLTAYLKQTVGMLLLLYVLAGIAALVIRTLRDAAAHSTAIDAFLRALPLVGKIRRAFATSRFCATYEMQLAAGVNVLDALGAAARASQSALANRGVHRAIGELRAGHQVGQALGASGAFPEPMIRAVCVGEETGELEEELTRVAADYLAEGLARLDTLAEWLPRLLYLAVLVTLGWKVISWYRNYLGQVESILG